MASVSSYMTVFSCVRVHYVDKMIEVRYLTYLRYDA